MYSSSVIAAFFLKKSFKEGIIMTPMKLLKLVYIAHGWTLSLTEEPLLSEQIEAWKYGPVIPQLYNQYREFGANDINRMLFNNLNEKEELKKLEQSDIESLLDKVWIIYKDYSGIELSSLTHKDGTPWDIIWETTTE